MSAQKNTPEENDQSSSMLSNTDKFQSETCNPPSPDLTSKRRKLGSRRKNKERQHVKDSANELYHKPREEVEEITKGNEALETTQLPMQPERQEGLSQGSKHDMSVTHDGSLYLASTSGYSCEVENLTTSCPEDIPESPENGNQQGGKGENETGSKVTSNSCGLVETVQEETDKSETLQSEEVKENAHIVASSDLISSGPLSSEPLGVHSATEEENKESDEDTDLLRQDGDIKGNDLLSESHVESVDKEYFITAEVTPDEKNPRQTECSIDHLTLPIEELSADENQIERSPLPLDAQPQDSSVCIVEQMDTDFLSTVNRRKLGSSRRTKKRQPVKDYVAESNRETNEEVDENVRGYEVFETTKLSSLIETSAKVKSEETMLEEIDISDTHQNEKLSGQVKEIAHLVDISESSSSTLHPTPSVNQQINQSYDREMPHELPSVYSLTDVESKESDEVNVSHGNLESPVKPEISTENSLGQLTEPECYVEQAIDSSPKEELTTNEDQEEHFSSSEVRGAEDAESKVPAEELEPAEMQEIILDDSTESVTHEAAENSEICFANLADQAEVSDSYQSESSVKSTAHSATKHGLSNLDDKQDKHPTLEGNKEPLDQINEEYSYDHESPQTSDIEIVDTAVSDQKKERLVSEVTESESPTQTLQSGTDAPFDSPQDNAVIIDEKNNTDFNPTRNRKKMGSSRRIKGRQNVQGPAPESEMSLAIETAVQEISMDVMLEGNDKLDPSQTEEISDTIMEDAHASTSGLTSISAHSSPPGDQQVIEQSNSRQMPEELASMFIAADTESKESDEDTDLLRQWGILQAGSLVNETRLPSESDESSVTPEITTEKNNHREHTEPKCGVEQATVSSPKEEMSASEEQNEHFSFSEVRGAQHTQDAAEEVGEDEVKPTQMQTMHQIDYSSTKESKSSLQTLQSDTKSHLDSQPMDSSLSIEEETPSSFKPTGNRRKLGSSRRNKVKQHVPEPVAEPKEEVENIDRVSDNEKMPLATETTRQEVSREQTGPDLKPTEKTRKIRSAVKEEENIDPTPDKDTALSQNIVDSGNTVTTDFILTSDKGDLLISSEEVNEVEEKLIKEPEHLTPRTGYDKVQMDLVQSLKDDSDTQNISYHDDTVSNRPVAYDLLYQEQVLHVQNTESLSRDTDSLGQEINIQHTNYVKETGGNVTITDHSTEAETPMDSQGPGQVEVGEEECKDPANKDLAAQVTHAQLFSGTQNITETLASFDIGHEENLRAMPAVNVSEESGISTAADSSNSQQEIPERPAEDFRSSELQTNRQSINPLSPPNAEGTDSGVTVSFCETATGTQNDEQSPEGIEVIQDQASKSTESPSYVVAESVAGGGAGEQHENVQAGAQESTNRRRKMGSTRRNLGSRSKVKDLHEKQEVDNNEATATKCGDVLTESVSGISEKEPQLHDEQKDSDSKQRRERVFETVEFRHTGESQVKPLAQQTDEETPDSLSQLAETEHHLTPDHPPAKPTTSSRHDDMSELAAGGRRRKMGSHRKSHGHQRYNDQTAREDRMKDAQQGGDVVSLTDERDTDTRGENREEPSGMDRTPEVDESSNISISNRTEHSRPLRAPERETPVQHPRADTHLRPESQKFSLAADSRGADVRSKHFNVLLVGNSSVGKTSFMKRAHSGMFPLDLAASVGLDSCMWTVAVDGKPVVLRLWDTAGQERFHSITTQVFHKAQAFLLMYDITSPQSFSAISYWANCIQEGAADDVTVVLLGNKSDCGERQVKTQEGEFLAKEYNFEFMECSAATGENVIHSLETVARMLSQMVDTREEAMVLHKEPPQKKRSGCC